MSNRHALSTRHNVIVSYIVIVMGLLFALVSCSTLNSANSDNTVADRAAATIADNNTAKSQGMDNTANKTIDNKIDKTMDSWEKAHALYLRTLDYAQIDQQGNSRNEYLVKSNLIESRYHIEDSETDLFVEHNLPKALQELRTAARRYYQAMSMARPQELNALKDTKSDLDSLLKQADLVSRYCCEYPQREDFQVVETEIKKLLVKL